MSKQQVQHYQESTFHGDWTIESAEKALQLEKKILKSLNDPSKHMTTAEYLALHDESDGNDRLTQHKTNESEIEDCLREKHLEQIDLNNIFCPITLSWKSSKSFPKYMTEAEHSALLAGIGDNDRWTQQKANESEIEDFVRGKELQKINLNLDEE